MHSAQLELRVITAIESLQNGTGGEDDFIEFKQQWPDDDRAFARQLAGSLNRASMEPVLVVIGVKDGTGQILKPEPRDVSNWWPQIQKHFDQVPPEMIRDKMVPIGSSSVHAFAIASDRAPYVHKTGKDPVRFEVPIREGTRTVTAHRDQIMRMVAPVASVPSIHALWASFTAVTEYEAQDADGELLQSDAMLIRGVLEIFIEATPGSAVMFPRHAITGTVKVGERELMLYSDQGGGEGGKPLRRAGVTDSSDGYEVAGAGSCSIPMRTRSLDYETFTTINSWNEAVEVDVLMRGAGTNRTAHASLVVPRRDAMLDGLGDDVRAISAAWRYSWRSDAASEESQ